MPDKSAISCAYFCIGHFCLWKDVIVPCLTIFFFCSQRLEKTAHPDLKDVGKVQELIKANLQRSKVVQDSVKEAKHHLTNEIFEHKDRVKDIVKKYVSKRQVKKRELS